MVAILQVISISARLHQPMAPNLRAPIALRVGATLTCQPDQRRFFGFQRKKSRKKRRNKETLQKLVLKIQEVLP